MRTKLLNLPVDVLSKEEISSTIKSALINANQLKIITLNPEMIINAIKNIEFQNVLKDSDFIVADGTGIVWALKLNGFKNAERIPGIELAEKILELVNKSGKSVAILGSTDSVISKTLTNLKEKYPLSKIAYSKNGFFKNEEESAIATDMAKNDPDVIFVALGSPKQELWINKYSMLFPKSIMIGIGGSLDVWSGKKQRAPKWIRDMHMEWLFSVMNEPERIPRVLKSLPRFIYLVMKARFANLAF